jgi:hypothetical protein
VDVYGLKASHAARIDAGDDETETSCLAAFGGLSNSAPNLDNGFDLDVTLSAASLNLQKY